MNDEIEFGDSGLIHEGNGWFKDKYTGNTHDPEGRIYDREGELIHDPAYDDEDS